MGGKKRGLVRKLLKAATPFAGAAIGTALLGPAGGMIGGGLGGASTRSDRNKPAGFASGFAQGALYSALAPMIGSALPGSFGGGSNFMNSISGANSPSLLNQLGIASAPSSGGGLGFIGNFGRPGVLEGPGGIAGPGGFLSGLIPGTAQGGQGVPSQFGPAGSSAFNMISRQFGRRGQPSQAPQGLAERQEAPFLESVVNRVGNAPLNMPSPEDSGRGEGDSANARLTAIMQNPTLSVSEKLMQLLRYLEGSGGVRRARPQQPAAPRQDAPREQPEQPFKKGGYVGGYSGGQDDNVKMNIPEGSYVQDATTVSLLGDGNSLNGMKKLKKMEDDFLRSGIVRNPPSSYRIRTIRAKVSPGEFVHRKEFVDAIGGGNNGNGAKILNGMRKNVREHKGVSKFLPPKSKPIAHYMGGKARAL